MYKVYFNDKVIIFDKNTEKYNGKDTILFSEESQKKLCWNELREKTLEQYDRIVFLCENPDTVLKNFFSQFRILKAGGGLVKNNRKEILMIFRWERWDLPKGQMEPGEQIQQCAKREVSEECGLELNNINIIRETPIAETFHLYEMKGEWLVKDTTWYDMQYDGTAKIKPQTEEGITDIAWVPESKIADHLKGSYHTIRDVFEAGGYIL